MAVSWSSVPWTRLSALAAALAAGTPLIWPPATPIALPMAMLLALASGVPVRSKPQLEAIPKPPAPVAPPSSSDDRPPSWFNDAPVPLLRIGRDHRIIAGNPALLPLLGTAESWSGRDIRTILATDNAGALEEVLTKPNGPASVDVVLAGPAARKANLHLTAPDLNGERMIYVVDVTAVRELEGQIIQSGKMRAVGQLAGGIAHDFNNLLTAMIGFCDLLLQRHKAGDASFADIMQIKQNANRAASLVRQLLAFSRQQTLRPKVLDITDTLNELSHLLRRLIGQNIVLRLGYGRDLGLVRVDQNQFEQVVVNLAVNARDAMVRGGELAIQCDNVEVSQSMSMIHEIMPPGAYVLVQVRDSGTGIPPDMIGQIFEPFFTTKPMGEGTGLGLSTVYGIVRQTGGFIRVESEIGKGSVFSIYLPRHAGQVAEEKPVTETERSEADTIGTGTILLVEDEDPVRLFTARALRTRGYQVLEARSGEAALDLLAGLSEPLDMMITDAVMPGIDGHMLIQRVRETRPQLKIICISGHTDDTLREQLINAGDVAFLPKPFSLKQLASRVREVLDGHPI